LAVTAQVQGWSAEEFGEGDGAVERVWRRAGPLNPGSVSRAPATAVHG
jgi:hypothetical protein